MFPLYLTYINHNRYLKIHYKTAYNYTDLQRIQILISFHKTLNNKFTILCIFFFFKQLFEKNGYFIILNKKNNKILGMKFYLTKSLMYKYLNFLIINFFNQPEIQNKLTLNSFDTMYNYSFTIANTYSYYLEKLVKNPIYKIILNEFDIKTTFIFSKIHEVNLYNNIFYLNFFKLYFNV